MLLLSYIREEEGRPEVLKGYEEEISRSNTPAQFHWPPKPPGEDETAPVYIAPPETQHAQPKPRSMLPQSAASEKQSISAPQLALMGGGPSDVSMECEQPEMYSDNSASTSTSTGDSSSEEYQVYSTNVSQQVVRYFEEPKPNPINAAVNYASNYAEMLRHKPSICSVEAGSYDQGYENERLEDLEEAYLVREPSEPPNYAQNQYEAPQKRVAFAMPAQEVYEREDSMSRETGRKSPRSVEGRHGPLYPNTLQIQHDMDSYYDDRRESGISCESQDDHLRRASGISYQSEDDYRRQSCFSYGSYTDDSRRESQVTAFEDKTLPFTQQYCSGDTRHALLKLEETKPCPLPISPNVNSRPIQWQSQMLKALTITPKEVEKDMDDPFARAAQEAYDQQIEDDRKARDNERRKLMDEMLAKQRAMRKRQEENEIDQARRFAPVSKLAPRTPDNWRPPQPTPTIPLPEAKEAYIPPPPSMEPIRRMDNFQSVRVESESPLLAGLKTASIRPYTPFSNEVSSQLMDMPTPVQQLTFSSALVTAPDRPFTPHNEYRDYNSSPLPYTPGPDYSQMPTEIYKENEEQIKFLEKEVDERLERRNSAFAKIKPVKPATPIHMRRMSNFNGISNDQRMDFPFTEGEVLESPRPIVCVPQECLSTYQSSCSVQQRAYKTNGDVQRQQQEVLLQQQRQQERLRANSIQRQEERNRFQLQLQQQQQQLRKQSHESISRPPPHPTARPPSTRRVQSQAHSPVLSKPDPAGLHKADDIPGYQRKWFNLPSQQASVTPEPHELIENVPLAFVAAPKEPSPTISKPIAISAANTYTTTFATLSNSYSNTSYESQQQQNHHALPPVVRKKQYEPRYSIPESQTAVVQEEAKPEPEPAAPPTEGKRMSRSSISYQNQQQQQQMHAQNEQLTQKARRSFAEAQPQQQSDSRRGSIAQSHESRKNSQIVEQQIQLQQQQEVQSSSRRTSTASTAQRRESVQGSIQERQNKFEQPAPAPQPPPPQETSDLDQEVQDMNTPRIRIVEPRWTPRTPSRQFLSEFEAHQSDGHMHGESFISDPSEGLRPQTPSSRPWTPSMKGHHRASHIPYYQEQLAWEEGVALSKEFEKKMRTPSPSPTMFSMRPKSPAFGPPPNPLLLIHPQTRDEGKDLSGKYLSGTKLLSPKWEEKHYKSEYLGLDADNPYYEKQQQSAAQKYYETPEQVQRQKVGNTEVETRSKESHLQQQKKAEIEKCEQLGDANTCVQRRTRIVEECEHSQTMRSMEKTTGCTLSILDDQFPPRGFVASQAKRLSVADSTAESTAANHVAKRQVGGGQEMRDFTVPTFRSQVSVQHASNMSSFTEQSSASQYQSSSQQVSQSSFPAKSYLPPPGFPTSADTPPAMLASQMMQQQQMKRASVTSVSSNANASSSNFNNGATNKPPLPPAINIQEQMSSNTNNNQYDPSPNSTNPSKKTSSDPVPGLGGISGKPYNVQNVTQPKRGRGVLQQAAAGRSAMCGCCGGQVRGPFITALGRIWCPEHFICVNGNCKRPLADIGFVEEKGNLYCEYCFEQYLAPNCSKCASKIKGDCLNAIGKQFHPECFTCSHCGKLFGNSPFFLEEGEPFCQNDWNQLFTTKCFACGFPVEAGDRWVEALNNNYHSQCFNCTMCKKNLEGQSFYAKGGRPFCKNHAR